jgi:AcrR family transcriptional regulator
VPSVTRRAQNRRAARRDEIRQHLLEAVERLVSDGQGFTELSVERLATEAGVSRSTFYVYFDDKAALLTAWLAEVIEEVTEAAQGWWALPGTAGRGEVRCALSDVMRTYRPHTVLMGAVLDASGYDPGVRADFDRFMADNIAALRAHIVSGQATGAVDPGLHPLETASWLTWMAERGLHVMVAAADEDELERLITAYADIIWNTLYAPVRRDSRPPTGRT